MQALADAAFILFAFITLVLTAIGVSLELSSHRA